MEFELRIIADCPHSAPALALLRASLADEGIDGEVRVVELFREEQAQALGFHGSPSFIADGRDLFPSNAPPALTCRLYSRGSGVGGLPMQKDIQAALRQLNSDT
ncbi:hypothetical protein [Arthrobacter sp. NicSoilB11]|uniref:hypothetical protein n=1 Tax=Arthrobacter sp. NicSoilB11 TaxID=2830999 RepID=UPI001CC5A52F|nr:hypothetical protein [Arthrobacter sp. NicSoilB11]